MDGLPVFGSCITAFCTSGNIQNAQFEPLSKVIMINQNYPQSSTGEIEKGKPHSFTVYLEKVNRIPYPIVCLSVLQLWITTRVRVAGRQILGKYRMLSVLANSGFAASWVIEHPVTAEIHARAARPFVRNVGEKFLYWVQLDIPAGPSKW